MAAYTQALPDLDGYRVELLREGAPPALPRVPFKPRGLLADLPEPPDGRRGWPWDVEWPPPSPVGDWPLISVVTPSYQQAPFLEQTIRSVLLQNYPELEFVVMDGGSTDGTSSIIERYGPWLSFHRRAKDRGQSHAINLGFSLASGKLRGWINSDDFYLPGALESVARTFNGHSGFVYGNSLELDESTGEVRHVIAGFAHQRYVAYPGLIPSHAAFWSEGAHKPVWEEQHCAMDYELWIRLLQGVRIRHVNRALGVLRVHPATKSANSRYQELWRSDARRNGLAHPELFGPHPWRDREFRAVQRLFRWFRSLGESESLRKLQLECGWAQIINSER